MYVPKIFQSKSIEDVRSYVDAHSFATLISAKTGHLVATHTPMIIEQSGSEEFLVGHIAVANTQHEEFDGVNPLLAIFMEKHSYISSSWYDHVNVPTWNYIAVHVHGTATVMDEKELIQSLHQLVDKYEPSDGTGFSIDQMPEDMLRREVNGIVGFRMRIEKIQASYKLSQNRHDTDYENIMKKLKERGDSLSIQIAEEMAKLR